MLQVQKVMEFEYVEHELKPSKIENRNSKIYGFGCGYAALSSLPF